MAATTRLEKPGRMDCVCSRVPTHSEEKRSEKGKDEPRACREERERERELLNSISHLMAMGRDKSAVEDCFLHAPAFFLIGFSVSFPERKQRMFLETESVIVYLVSVACRCGLSST
jgi:hypothetical protein